MTVAMWVVVTQQGAAGRAAAEAPPLQHLLALALAAVLCSAPQQHGSPAQTHASSSVTAMADDVCALLPRSHVRVR